MRRMIALVLSALFLGSIAILLLFFRDAAQGSLKFEAAKSLLQLGVVSVVGAVVSILVFEYQRERQAIDKKRELDRKRLEYRETLLLSILSRTMDAYGRVKKARRILRGRTISSEAPGRLVPLELYDANFDVLNDAQLDFENLARDVDTSAKAFAEPKALVENLRSMDDYLGELIGEYEDSRHRFSGSAPSLPLGELPRLEDFLGPVKGSDFLKQVVYPYHDVQKAIRADLLHPNLP